MSRPARRQGHGAGWRNEHNHHRPHSSLGYIAPGAFTAFVDVCEPDECQSCLCSTDPNCLEDGVMLSGTGPDYTQDGVVGDDDLNWMMKAYGYEGGRFDMNRDGLVDAKDVALLVEAWGPVKLEQ